MTIHEPEMRRADGAIFLTVAENDRLAISTSIERLIDLLDAMSPDPDIEATGDDEPSLGWPDRGPSALRADMDHDDREADDCDLEDNADAEPSLGSIERHPASLESPWGRSGVLYHDRSRGQDAWGAGSRTDGEDDAGENAEVEESGYGDVEGMVAEESGEPSLGLTEEINQVRRTETDPKQWYVEDGEPELGWTGHGMGCTKDEPGDDREGDDECEPNGDELDHNGDEGDTSFTEDEPYGSMGAPDGSGHKIAKQLLRENARRLSSGDIVREISPPAKGAATRIVFGKGNVVDPDWMVDAIPQIDPAKWREAHYRAAHERRQ